VSFGYFLRPQADRDIDEIADYIAWEAGLDVGLRFLSDL
jgi:plasmid stabilization system protein ParE